MSVDALMTRPCEVVTVTQSEDQWGTPVDMTSATTTVCELQQQRRGTEGPDEWQTSRWRLFLPRDTDVTGIDKVTVDGILFTVDGPPWRVRNPRDGTVSHIEVSLEAVE